jgi:hypothetical protein
MSLAAAHSTGTCRVPRTGAPPKRDKPAEVTAPEGSMDAPTHGR